jgi:plastocyanin
MSTSVAGAAGARRGGRAGLVPAALVALAVLSGCTNTEPALPEATRTAGGDVGAVSTAEDGVQEITLTTGDDYVFTPDSFTVAPGPVRLTVRNEAEQMTHNLEFTAGQGPAAITEKIPILAPGDVDTIEFAVSAPGDYPFECSFHIRMGQVGTMTVQG